MTTDDLTRRSQEHGELIADIVDLGHRMGFSCWIGERQQRRRAGGVPLMDRLDDRELAGPPYFGRIRGEDLEDVDVIWYVRGRAAFLWEVEWTAMLGDTVLRRHARMPPDERLVRFLVVLPERAELVRHKLERSPLLRDGARDRRLAHPQGQPPARLGEPRGGGAGGHRAASSGSTRPSSGRATSSRCSAAEPPR